MFGLIPLAIVAAIVFAVVRRSGDAGGPGGGSAPVRRLFQYGILFAALIVAAVGFGNLLGVALGGAAVGRAGSQVATPLALTVVGVPVFWLVGRWVWRGVSTDDQERGGLGWSLYLSAALLGSLGTVVGTAFGLAEWLVGAGSYDGEVLGHLLVWSAVWGLHWTAWRLARPTLWPGFHLWVGAAIGLGVLAGSAGSIFASLIDQAVNSADGVAARTGVGEDLRIAIAGVVIGGAVWTWYWLRNGLRAERTVGWHVYVMLAGVLGGLVTAISGGGVAIYLVLQWLFGDPGTGSAARHFADIGVPIGTALAGIGAWVYHRAVVGYERTDRRREIDRFYDHTIAGVALMTTAIAVTILIVALFEVLTPEVAFRTEASDSNIVIAAVTLLIVGVPTWSVVWRRIQHAVTAAFQAEAASITRRTYLFVLFGLGGAVAFGALIRLLIVMFDAATEGFSGAQLSRDLSVPTALLVTTGVIAGYHWVVFRSERHVAEPRARRIVLLVCAGQPQVAEIEERTHVRITVLNRLDLDDSESIDVESVVQAIESTEGERVLVVVGAEGVQTVPYR